MSDVREFVIGPDHNGRIVHVRDGFVIDNTHETPEAGPDAERVALAPDDRILPGGVNAHTHLYSALAPRLPEPSREPKDFLEILELIWWRLDRALDADTLRASARRYVADALLAGTTTLVDHHESPSFIGGSLDVLGDACDELGIRAVLAYGATERNGGPGEAVRGLDENRRFFHENARRRVRVIPGLHAAFTVSDETLRNAVELARETGLPLHVHVAEDAADGADAKNRGYEGVWSRLVACGLHEVPALLAHGVHLTPEEVEAAAGAGHWFVQNPRSNRGNHVGYPKSLSRSRRVALGTDGYPSDMFEESRVLLEEGLAQGEDEGDLRARMSAGRKLVSEMTGELLGELRAGETADLVVRDAGSVRHVMVGGQWVVRDGKLVAGDEEEIEQDAERAADTLRARLKEI